MKYKKQEYYEEHSKMYLLMENKKLTVLDEGEIYQKARQAIKELKEAI